MAPSFTPSRKGRCVSANSSSGRFLWIDKWVRWSGRFMNLDYIPLLQVQRDLQALPRNYERFQEYLRTMTNAHGDLGMLVPLLAVNPMAKEHVTAILDAYLALGADAIGAEVLAAA